MQRGWVQKLPSGRWSIQWRDVSGRKVRGGTFARRTDALAELARVLPPDRHSTPSRDITLDDLVERFMASYEAKPATVKRVRYQLALAQAAFGSTKLRALSAEDVAAWRLTLPERSRYQIHAVLSMALQRAVTWGVLHRNVAKEVRNPTPKPGDRAFFDTWADVESVDAEMGHHRGLAIFAAGTGLRPAEWMGTRWQDIDLDARVLLVEGQLVDGRWTPYTKTTRSRRRVPLRSVVIDALPAASNGLVWVGKRGAPLDLRTWRRRVWQPALDAAGLDRRDVYALRRTYASMSLAAGMNLFTLARRMGTSVQMIDQAYGHLLADSDDLERDLLDAWDARQRAE